MASNKTVFITGISGYLGQKIVEHICNRDDIGEIIGVDIVEPPLFRDRITFIEHDVRDDLYPVMSRFKIDWAIHGAYIVSVLHNKNLAEDIDVNGTKNFLASCGRLKIKSVMHISSATAYGFHEDNPPVLTEESPLRGNDYFTYGKCKADLELGVVEDFRKSNPGIILTIIRPSFVCGPHFYKNPLGRHLMKKVIMLPRQTQPFQYVHEDDLAESVYFLLKNKKRGAYNLGGDGTMTFREMAQRAGGIILPLPVALLKPLNNIAWFLRLKFITEFPSSTLSLVICPWVVSNKKIKDAGFRFRYTTAEAYETFAEQVRNYRGRT